MDFFGWIDFSQEHRNRVNSVLDLFLEEGVVDELGVGVIRDALSDKLFPGINTLQTRAKYYFIIPYIIKDYSLLSDNVKKNKPLRRYLEETENEINRELAEKYRNSEEKGIFGIRNPILARRPSSIYWYGILSHGMIKSDLSLESYLSRFDNKNADSLRILIKYDDSQQDDQDADFDDNFGIKVPYKKNWRNNLDILLSFDEADFLRNRFIDRHADKLLGTIVRSKTLTDEFLSSDSFDDFSLKIFESDDIYLSQKTKKIVQLAYDFNKIMEGAHIRYNCMLQERYGIKGAFEDEWEEWKTNIQDITYDLNNFDSTNLFHIANRTKEVTMNFVTKWVESIKSGNFNTKMLDQFVATQEKINKGSKSRLKQGVEESINSWIGLRNLTYRFNRTHQMIEDIINGLKSGK